MPASAQNRNSISIIQFEDRLAGDFGRLNREWLDYSDLMEPADAKYLDSPREAIIRAGGRILFAVEKEDVVGTCAVIPHGEATIELAKLAVTSSARGRGIGRRLTIAAIEQASLMKAEKVILVSNSRLISAIRLYESIGFKHAPITFDPIYAGADVYMELSLRAG